MNIVLLESLGISNTLLESYADRIRKSGHSFTVWERTDDETILIEHAKDADVLILANMPLSGRVIRACPNLKFINIAFTGVDHVDLNAAREMGVSVSNASGYSTDAVAELTLGLALALLRNLPQVDTRCREGQTKVGLIGNELHGKTVGIVGTGAIGSRVAELFRAFGCRILASNDYSHKTSTEQITYLPLHEMLPQVDLISLHCPLNENTRGLIGKEELALLKPSSLVLNTARGPVVDTNALAEALNSHQIAGAGIDVFETEPPLALDHPLLHTPNTIVTPHVAFATEESMVKRAKIVFDNLDQWISGNQVNTIL